MIKQAAELEQTLCFSLSMRCCRLEGTFYFQSGSLLYYSDIWFIFSNTEWLLAMQINALACLQVLTTQSQSLNIC